MKTFVISLNVILGICAIIGSSFVDSGDSVALIIVGLIMIAGSVFAHFYSIFLEKSKERLEKIKTDYYDALKGSDKSEALRLGREYYGSLREDGAVTTYDEQAINNDLNSMIVPTEVVRTQVIGSSLEKLEKLAQLKAQGVLTEDEFKVEKAKILSER